MFVRESTPLPCGPAFIGLRHSPLNVGLAAGVVALQFQQSPFNGPATLALATSGIVGGATLAYFVQAHFNRRLLAVPVNITSGNLYHTAVVHPACPLGSSSFGSGDALDNLMCPSPFDYGNPGRMCEPLSQMHALELDNWFSEAISSCEAGDAPETDLIVLPSVPPTSPLRSSSTDFGLKSITVDLTVLSGWHQPLQTPTADEPVSISSPRNDRNPHLVPTMIEAQLATRALVAVGTPRPSTRTLTISQHVRGIFNCVCVLFVLFLIVLYTCKAFAYGMCKVSLSFVKRESKIVPVALPSTSAPANEVSEERDDFFYPTPNPVDDTSIEEVQASPVEDHNVSSLVDAQSVASESMQEDVAVEGVEEAAPSDSEEVQCNTVQEELNDNVPLDDPISSVGVQPILDESPCFSVHLNPDAHPFVPGALELPSTTSTALETVESPPAPASIPTHISARPPGRRRRKHHRKNKNKVVEINLVG